MKEQSTTGIEIGISRILQIGVTVSVATILLGVLLLFMQQGSLLYSASYDTYVSTNFVFAHSVSAFARSIAAGEGLGIIELGLLLLIVTPITRVAVSFVLFLRKRDVSMMFVTSFVLLVLIGSFYVGIISG